MGGKKAFIEAEWKIKGLENRAASESGLSQMPADAGTIAYGN